MPLILAAGSPADTAAAFTAPGRPCWCSCFPRREGKISSSVLTQAAISAEKAQPMAQMPAQVPKAEGGCRDEELGGSQVYGIAAWKASPRSCAAASHPPVLTGPSPLLVVTKTKWQSWRGFTQGHQLLCWPRRLLPPGFALEEVHLGCWQCGILGEPQVAAVLMAERPTRLLIWGCSPHPSWKPSGAGAPLGAGSVLNPIAQWKCTNMVRACEGTSKFLCPV